MSDYDPTLKIEWDGRVLAYTPLDTTCKQTSVIEAHTGKAWAEWEATVTGYQGLTADVQALYWVVLEQNGITTDIGGDFKRGRFQRAFKTANDAAQAAYVASLSETEVAERADPTVAGPTGPGGSEADSDLSDSTS